MDLLTTAVLNRSLSLLDGFVVLVRGNNTLAALHLVRIQGFKPRQYGPRPLDELALRHAGRIGDSEAVCVAEGPP